MEDTINNTESFADGYNHAEIICTFDPELAKLLVLQNKNMESDFTKGFMSRLSKEKDKILLDEFEQLRNQNEQGTNLER